MMVAMFKGLLGLVVGFSIYALSSDTLEIYKTPKPEETIVEVWPRGDLVCYKLGDKLISCERVGLYE